MLFEEPVRERFKGGSGKLAIAQKFRALRELYLLALAWLSHFVAWLGFLPRGGLVIMDMGRNCNSKKHYDFINLTSQLIGF